MKTLFLAWQDKHPTSIQGHPGGWYPIGRLDAEPDKDRFRFRYTLGARRAAREAGFRPLEAFPDIEKLYESRDLFPLFQNRLPNASRGDFGAFVDRLGLGPEAVDPFEILAVSGGGRQTDNLEVVPKISTSDSGAFTCRFFLHGWRYVSIFAQTRIEDLKPGEQLRIAVEINNPATGKAVQLQTQNDYQIVGWAPRYLIEDILQALGENNSSVSASVVKVNLAPAPYNQRALIQLDGKLPTKFEPMSSPDFQVISPN